MGLYDVTDYISFPQSINVFYSALHLKYVIKPLKMVLLILDSGKEEKAAK